jgi:hypothetical protein
VACRGFPGQRSSSRLSPPIQPSHAARHDEQLRALALAWRGRIAVRVAHGGDSESLLAGALLVEPHECLSLASTAGPAEYSPYVDSSGTLWQHCRPVGNACILIECCLHIATVVSFTCRLAILPLSVACDRHRRLIYRLHTSQGSSLCRPFFPMLLEFVAGYRLPLP